MHIMMIFVHVYTQMVCVLSVHLFFIYNCFLYFHLQEKNEMIDLFVFSFARETHQPRYIACAFFMFQTYMERIKIYVRRAKPRHCRWHAVVGRHYFVLPTGTVCIYVCRTLRYIEQAGPPYVRTVPRPGAVRFRSSRRIISMRISGVILHSEAAMHAIILTSR